MTALLTARQHDVMTGVCAGLSNREIGEQLNLSFRTVEIHRAEAIKRLNARNSVHAAILFDRSIGGAA